MQRVEVKRRAQGSTKPRLDSSPIFVREVPRHTRRRQSGLACGTGQGNAEHHKAVVF